MADRAGGLGGGKGVAADAGGEPAISASRIYTPSAVVAKAGIVAIEARPKEGSRLRGGFP
jgi:hypothetical protein